MKFLDIKHIVSAAALAIVAFGFTACTKDLDVEKKIFKALEKTSSR